MNLKPRIERLPSLGVRANTISVSGFSAGAFMASHLHLIYSDVIKGCGLISGGSFPWYLERRTTKNSLDVNVDLLVEHTKRLESLQHITPLSNIKHSPVLIYHGEKDQVLSPGITEKAFEYYTKVGADV